MGAAVGVPLFIFDVGLWSRLEAFVYITVSIIAGAVIYFTLTVLIMGLEKLKNYPVVGKVITRIK
ncbi:hypothetical protein [Tuberibacillus sp. Marseille-P3662]|uniref:hypothetical protein n=1 Tax=Tuberibacillus sp. Marseille-P3662 TaxID=1965358 RepID=UPI000A1CD379|nr:hypothetical protein [Tuberibacillus sp. Marseille-P3662]